MHAASSGIQCIVALSGDADVFVRLMHYGVILHSEGLTELSVRAGVGDPVHILTPQLDNNLAICYH